MVNQRNQEQAPVIVGGTGGSGTRVVQELLEAAGVFMGSNLNVSRDAMDFEPLLDNFINPVLEATHTLDYMPGQVPTALREAAIAGIRSAAAAYLRDMPEAATRGGWKNPRSMYMLPLIYTIFPDLIFIHVVRDGRDMAFSENQQQVTKHYTALFGEPVTSLPHASIRLWSKANGEIAAWAERTLGRRYQRIVFEHLCANPAQESAKIFDWLRISPPPAARIKAIVQPPVSIARWKEQPPRDIKALQVIAGDTLRTFGYL